MTDECRPAAGAADGSLHWLRGRNMDVCDTAKWHSNPSEFWTQDGEEYWPDQMARHYIYHAPASPEDATERARLEGEVERLWEALRAIRDHYFEFIDNSDIDKRDAEMSAPSVLANINGIARAALTPGGAS